MDTVKVFTSQYRKPRKNIQRQTLVLQDSNKAQHLTATSYFLFCTKFHDFDETVHCRVIFSRLKQANMKFAIKAFSTFDDRTKDVPRNLYE